MMSDSNDLGEATILMNCLPVFAISAPQKKSSGEKFSISTRRVLYDPKTDSPIERHFLEAVKEIEQVCAD